jgi:hypothetical protein
VTPYCIWQLLPQNAVTDFDAICRSRRTATFPVWLSVWVVTDSIAITSIKTFTDEMTLYLKIQHAANCSYLVSIRFYNKKEN